MQGIMVWSLVQDDPICWGATKPVCHNYWAWTLEPVHCNYWAHVQQLLKPVCPKAQEKPLQWEARAPKLESSPHSPRLGKAWAQQETQHSQKQIKNMFKKMASNSLLLILLKQSNFCSLESRLSLVFLLINRMLWQWCSATLRPSN